MTKLAIEGGEPIRKHPFVDWPYYDQQEKAALVRALEQGQWWRMAGTEVSSFEEEFAAYTSAFGGALAVTNGTQALEIALRTLDIGEGDEVIVPAFTFISTSMAVQRTGAIAIPVDVNMDTYCMDLDTVVEHITPKTKAVIPVHMAGHTVDLAAYEKTLGAKGISIIQDACHAHGAKSHGKKIGEWDSISCYSFQNYKLITAGEGGALVFPTKELHEKAFLMHNCGRPEGDTAYLHQISGSNNRMSEFAAAVLRVQLQRLEQQNAIRERNGALLDKKLLEIPGITPQKRKSYMEIHPHYMTIFSVCPDTYDALSRDFIVDALVAEGIPAFKNYKPIYQTKAFWQNPCPKGSIDVFQEKCKNTEQISAHGIWIHHRALLGGTDDITDVVRALEKVLATEKTKKISYVS